MTAPAGETRRVRIETPSSRAELLLVVRAGMAIIVGVWLYLASHSATFGSGATSQRNLLPFQKLIANEPPEEQRMFRELQEGLLEAERTRATTGLWPTPQSMADEGIPPFAPDPTRHAGYAWERLQGGTLVNYLGIPAADGPGWLVIVQEPEPGAPPDPAAEDEEHHRLVNGPMLHVSTWVHADGRKIQRRLVRLPQAEGWTQLYAVGPSPTIAVPTRPVP